MFLFLVLINSCFRYQDADQDGKLFMLLKICKCLDPRLAEKEPDVIDNLVVEAVAAELSKIYLIRTNVLVQMIALAVLCLLFNCNITCYDTRSAD